MNPSMPWKSRVEVDVNAQVVEEFRASHGRVGGHFDGVRLLLLTTTVAESKGSRTTPVGYFPDGNRKLIIAVSTEVPGHPPWYHDLLAQPQVTVEEGPFILQAEASVLDGDERDRVFARLAEADPALAGQQAGTTCVIPVVALDTISGAPTETMLGKAIKATHDAYRRELALVRTEVATSGAGVGAQLRINCLTVCQGIHQHHTGEDTRIFPSVHKEHPELAPLLERLRRDHQTVQRILDSLQEVVSTNQPNSAQVLTEVERLIAELEAHLDYEEAHLLPTLNTVPL